MSHTCLMDFGKIREKSVKIGYDKKKLWMPTEKTSGSLPLAVVISDLL